MPSAPCLHSLVRSQVTPSPPPRLIGAGLAAASVAQSLLEVYAATTASTPRIAPADMRDQERRQGRHDQRAAADVAPWATATSLCILSLFLGAIADANAASTIKITCNGSLTNTRAGVTLGQCDLNFISVKQMDEIQTVCARLIRPLKINAEYERLFRPIQLRPQITGSYTRFLSCGR